MRGVWRVRSGVPRPSAALSSFAPASGPRGVSLEEEAVEATVEVEVETSTVGVVEEVVVVVEVKQEEVKVKAMKVAWRA